MTDTARRESDREAALAMDAADPLAHCRNRFDLPADAVYLDGNSLGALPAAVPRRLAEVTRGEWGQDLISSWNRHDWINLPVRVGEKIAPLVGAAAGQVICADSTSVNLFKLLCAGLALSPGRHTVLSQRDNFPTDLYMVQGIRNLVGSDRCQLELADEAGIEAALHDDVAVLLLTQVNFRSGRMHDMAAVTRAAHAAGALVIWDLSHSAGALPVALDACDVDFAAGCGYKFLNGGPGAPAWLYVATRHHAVATQPLAGWMGHSNPFEFSVDYDPAPGVQRFASGTPSILGLAALDAALDAWQGVDAGLVRAKSVALGDQFIAQVAGRSSLRALKLASPHDSSARGSQVCFAHADGYAIIQALIARGIIGDFREPDILRFGLTPLYTRHIDVTSAVDALDDILTGDIHHDPAFSQRATVT